jgi:hypothetical protein
LTLSAERSWSASTSGRRGGFSKPSMTELV